jgi:hypothetical protein
VIFLIRFEILPLNYCGSLEFTVTLSGFGGATTISPEPLSQGHIITNLALNGAAGLSILKKTGGE